MKPNFVQFIYFLQDNIKMPQQKEKHSNTMISQSHLRTRIIPLSIQVNSKLGILNFPGQSAHTKLQKPQLSLKHNTQVVAYRNNIHGSSSEEESEEEIIRKRQICTDIITIKAQNIKKKYFKVEIPISKAGSLKNRQKKHKEHFIIQFSLDKGTLTVVNDVFDAKAEVYQSSDNSLSFDQKLKLQNAKLDNRRREEKVEILVDKKKK